MQDTQLSNNKGVKWNPALRPPSLFCPKKNLNQTISYLNNTFKYDPINKTYFPWPKGGCIDRVPL